MWKEGLIAPQRPGADLGLAADAADFTALPRIQRVTALARFKGDLVEGFGAGDLTDIEVDGNWLGQLATLMDVDPGGAALPIRRNESIPDTMVDVVRAINAEGLEGGPRDGLLVLMQMALDTGNDTLRELVRQHGPVASADLPGLRAALRRLAARLDDSTANTLTIEAMDRCLADLEQENA